jgi:hypothetical protein
MCGITGSRSSKRETIRAEVPLPHPRRHTGVRPKGEARAAGNLDGRGKEGCVTAFNAFAESYGTKYDKAVDCLTKDRDTLLAFYDFPAEHWKHLRTTNPIESTFATVRHRTIRSKGCLSNKTALAMVFKLVEGAQKSWRRLDGHNQLPKLIQGVKFTDGIEARINDNCYIWLKRLSVSQSALP